jgi:hypothetical protein
MDNKPKIIKITNKNKELLSDSDNEQDNILNKLFEMSNKILKSQELILTKIDSLENRIKVIETKIEYSKKCDQILVSNNLKELKKEELDLNKEEVLKALSYRDYRSVIYIFKNIYKNKTNSEYAYPIKIISKRCFEYYNNMKWNKDLDGHDIINILFTNIGNLFTKYNNINEIDMDEFILNQDFICKLWDEKFRKSIFKNIVEEVRINNL